MTKVSLQTIFERYQKKYPLFSEKAIIEKMEKDGIFTQLVKDGILLQSDVNRIKSCKSLFLVDCGFTNNETKYLNMDSFEPAKSKTEPSYKKPCHKKFPVLELNNNGNVDMRQFSEVAIRNKYNSEKYKIRIEKDYIEVWNKQTLCTVYYSTYDSDSNAYSVSMYDDTGRLANHGIIENSKIVFWDKYNKYGEIIYGERYSKPSDSSYSVEEKTITERNISGATIIKTYNRKNNQILEQTENYADGSGRFIQYENGNITYIRWNDKDDNETKLIEYTGNKPYVERDNNYKITRNFLIEDLTSKINKINILGTKTTHASLIQDIKTRINKVNASEVWMEYYKKNGRDLFDDIDKTSLDKKDKISLKNSIAKKIANCNIYVDSDICAKILSNDINGAGSGNLKWHIQAIFNEKNTSRVQKSQEIIDKYRNLTGNNLSNDIDEEYGLSDERKRLSVKVDKTYIKMGIEHENTLKHLADRISYDIQGPGSGNLEEHIMMINSENVIGVIKNYTRPQIWGFDVTKILNFFGITREDYEDWASMEPLICAIFNESGLSDNTKQKLVSHIITCVDNCHKSKHTYLDVPAHYSDIAHDLTANKKDSSKVKIDAKRLDNRIESSYENTLEQKKPLIPNGKIDKLFYQNTTGDCWLLAGLISAFRKPLGRKRLEDLLTVDNQKRQVTVNLKGINKKYVLSFDEIIASNHLASGDGDVRAIEIAMDRYLKSEAYKGNGTKYNIVDINGNRCKTVFNALFGNSKEIDLDNVSKDDLNSQTKAYTITFHRTKIESHYYKNAAYDEKGKPMDIVRAHAYAVLKADDNYVWILNPWNPSLKKPIRIKWEKLKALDISVEYTDLK